MQLIIHFCGLDSYNINTAVNIRVFTVAFIGSAMYCFRASKPVISSRRFQLYVIALGVSMLAIQLEEVNGQTSKYFSMYYSV